MQLRDHPLVLKHDRSIWPPIWTNTRLNKKDKPRGEVGILRQVLMNETFDTQCFLMIEYNGNQYMGCLNFSQAGFCKQICAILELMIGRSLTDIGDLDLSHTL